MGCSHSLLIKLPVLLHCTLLLAIAPPPHCFSSTSCCFDRQIFQDGFHLAINEFVLKANIGNRMRLSKDFIGFLKQYIQTTQGGNFCHGEKRNHSLIYIISSKRNYQCLSVLNGFDFFGLTRFWEPNTLCFLDSLIK